MKRMSILLFGVAAVTAFLGCGGGGGGGVSGGVAGSAPGVDPLYLSGKMALFFETDSPSQLVNLGRGDHGTSYGQTVVGYVPEIPFASAVASRTETDSDSPWAFNQSDHSSTVIYPLTVGNRLFVVREFFSNWTTTADILEYAYDPLKRGFSYVGAAATGITGTWAIVGNQIFFTEYVSATWYLRSRFLGSNVNSSSMILREWTGRFFGVGNNLVVYVAPGGSYAPGVYKVDPASLTATVVTEDPQKLPTLATTNVYAGGNGLYWTDASSGIRGGFTVSCLSMKGILQKVTVNFGAREYVFAVTLDEQDGVTLATVIGNWVAYQGYEVKRAYKITGMVSVKSIDATPFTVGQFTQAGCQIMFMP